jgi:hypothetical protein
MADSIANETTISALPRPVKASVTPFYPPSSFGIKNTSEPGRIGW